MKYINIYSSKNGVGTTTFACLLADHYLRQGNKVLLLAREDDVRGITGHDLSNDTAKLTVSTYRSPLDDVTYDVCIVEGEGNDPLVEWNIRVTDNAYLSLKRTVNSTDHGKEDFAVAWIREGTALTHTDVKHVLSVPTFALPMNNTLGRKLDAGLWDAFRNAVTDFALITEKLDSSLVANA